MANGQFKSTFCRILTNEIYDKLIGDCMSLTGFCFNMVQLLKVKDKFIICNSNIYCKNPLFKSNKIKYAHKYNISKHSMYGYMVGYKRGQKGGRKGTVRFIITVCIYHGSTNLTAYVLTIRIYDFLIISIHKISLTSCILKRKARS